MKFHRGTRDHCLVGESGFAFTKYHLDWFAQAICSSSIVREAPSMGRRRVGVEQVKVMSNQQCRAPAVGNAVESSTVELQRV
jgi:hypothetical protein